MGGADITSKVKAAKAVVPQIYAYTTPEIARHNGWTKIGYTERDVDLRISEQTHTANVIAKKQWQGNATYEDGSGTFKDTDFHGYLKRLNINAEPKTEWFEIEPLPAKHHFWEFRENKGVLDTPAANEYTLRAEQEAAVGAALNYANSHEGGEFLWNAKPRFGKTLSAYDLCKRMGARKVLIITNRPAIANSWYDDYVKFIGKQAGYCFISRVDALANKPFCMQRDEYLTARQNNRENTPAGFIEFVSLSDLKGSIHFSTTGKHDKLGEVKDIEWDILIIDEAHEGIDTYKTDVAFDRINRKFTLHLSGTPFKAIANEKFEADAIYNWTYADEQQANEEWDNASEQPNPYAELPRLNMFTYKMSDIVADKVSKGIEVGGNTVEFAFDLNEFFKTKTGAGGFPSFEHLGAVKNFLDALTTQKKYPFSTPELRDELRHTLWMLQRVESARCLAKLLKKHPVFKDYEIVLAAGDGKIDSEEECEKAFDKVRRAIDKCDKTITLSVGQLTVGVTVPQWTAVLMLSNMKSPALYMQAAFRAQNPCLFERGEKFMRKQNAYVFDFDPARTLTVFEQFANDLYTTTAAGAGTLDARKANIRKLLNFFPVIGENDAGEMVELDAERVLSIPRKIRATEVVRRGFMSDFLFQNIAQVFHAPAQVIETITKFEQFKEPSGNININSKTAEDLSLNAEGEVCVPESLVVDTAKEMFGQKQYETLAQNLDSAIEQTVDAHANKQSEEDKITERLANEFGTKVTSALMDTAKSYYDTQDLPASAQKTIERKIKADVDMKINREVSTFKIERNIIEKERSEKLEEANTQQQANEINKAADERIKTQTDKLVKNLQESTQDMVRGASETIVCEVETAKRAQNKKAIEDTVKDHLRGFSRTIPSFLMAYGSENTTLSVFDTTVPSEVFYEVTSITTDEFRFLRDGGDYTNKETGEVEHFDGNLFDPVVFDDAVAQFIELRKELANYFDPSVEEDIFDYVPPQKTNQIFTPRPVVMQMVDMFEAENPGCFDNPEHTFADLYMKSGLYITEIIKRLYNNDAMRKHFPNDKARLAHILENQVFGIAPTQIIYDIATHYILGYSGEVGGNLNTNFVCADSAKLAKAGKLAEFVEQTFGGKL